MSRSGYVEDCDDVLDYGRWRGRLMSAVRGKRGQAFFKDLIAALDAMPKKELIAGDLRKDGEVCALGALGAVRGVDLESLDPEDSEAVAAKFDIAIPIACEVVYHNDEVLEEATPQVRWERMRAWATRHLKDSVSDSTQQDDKA